MIPSLSPGTSIAFRYPKENRVDKSIEWLDRRATIYKVRFMDEQPVEELTKILNPHVRRGRILLVTVDIDKQELRSFYVESMKDLRTIGAYGEKINPIECLLYVKERLFCGLDTGPTQLRAPGKDRTEGRRPSEGWSRMLSQSALQAAELARDKQLFCVLTVDKTTLCFSDIEVSKLSGRSAELFARTYNAEMKSRGSHLIAICVPLRPFYCLLEEQISPGATI